jgi:hypothetical protein
LCGVFGYPATGEGKNITNLSLDALFSATVIGARVGNRILTVSGRDSSFGGLAADGEGEASGIVAVELSADGVLSKDLVDDVS